MKTKGRPKSKNVVDLRGGPSKESFMHDLDSISATLRPRMQTNPKATKDLDGALSRMRQKNAVKQTRDRLPLEQAREIMKKRSSKSNKKQDRLK